MFTNWDSLWIEPVTLLSADVELGPDGTPYLLAIYHHAWWDKRTGLRCRLNRIPLTVYEGMSPEESLAYQIAAYKIGEPIGAHYDLLVDDGHGVWWWGDGYPELGS